MNVYADTNDDSEIILEPSEDAICYITGAESPEDVIYVIENFDISVYNDSLIEIVSVSNSTENLLRTESEEQQAIIITNICDNVVEKNVLMFYNIDGESIDLTKNDESVYRISSTSRTFDPLSWEGDFTITYRAYYFVYTDSTGFVFYKPYSLNFYYTEYNDVDIKNISASYLCVGFIYEYSSDSSTYVLSDYTGQINHYITLNEDWPVEGDIYHKINMFDCEDYTNHMNCDNCVLYVSNGSPTVGNYFEVTYTVYNESTKKYVTEGCSVLLF